MADDEVADRLARRAAGVTENDDKVQKDIDDNEGDELDGVLDSAAADIYDAAASDDREKAIESIKVALKDFFDCLGKMK